MSKGTFFRGKKKSNLCKGTSCYTNRINNSAIPLSTFFPGPICHYNGILLWKKKGNRSSTVFDPIKNQAPFHFPLLV